MNRFHKKSPIKPSAQPSRSHVALSDQRYADLLKSASAFFSAADGDPDGGRQEAIDQIVALMAQHGLTVDDLR